MNLFTPTHQHTTRGYPQFPCTEDNVADRALTSWPRGWQVGDYFATAITSAAQPRLLRRCEDRLGPHSLNV